MVHLQQLLDFDSGAYNSEIYDTTTKMRLIESLKRQYEPKMLLLRLYQIVQYIDQNVALKSELTDLKSELTALKSELRIPAAAKGGGRRKSRKNRRKSKKSRKHRRKSKRHSRR